MNSIKTDCVVLGAGPGGYAAAFYAADCGKKVILVDKDEKLGGVCLNRGCIPSKALLHATKYILEAANSEKRGIHFEKPVIQLDTLREWKNGIIAKLANGIKTIGTKRGVEILHGRGYFEDSHTLRVETTEGQKFIQFENAIIAVGSRPALPSAFDLGNPRIITSTEALNLEDIPENLLIVGGGYIGMELGTVYAALGSRLVVVEALDTLLFGADPDLVRPVLKHAQKLFKEIRLNTKVLKMATSGKQIRVTMETQGKEMEEIYDQVLVAIGRTPNSMDLGLENTRIERDEKGFIRVNDRCQTTDPGIYAIGDIVGGALLAHKAAKEARVAVESIVGEESTFKNIIIPCVVFTHPEVAWCGLTETEAKAKGIKIEVSRFSWAASGRALAIDKPEGLTKLIIDPETERILGMGIVGENAGDLISEGVLAVECGLTAKDIALTVHPHPTLSETVMETAEVFYGLSSHAISLKREPLSEKQEIPILRE